MADEGDGDVDAYIGAIALNREYGDNICLAVISYVFRVEIHVVSNAIANPRVVIAPTLGDEYPGTVASNGRIIIGFLQDRAHYVGSVPQAPAVPLASPAPGRSVSISRQLQDIAEGRMAVPPRRRGGNRDDEALSSDESDEEE